MTLAFFEGMRRDEDGAAVNEAEKQRERRRQEWLLPLAEYN